ncbi:MAG: peptidylprolyl isomerase [Bacteroidetes bacterium]|nr:MAG: peptidylprolyl isomerase [Bacteroidota bacterium]
MLKYLPKFLQPDSVIEQHSPLIAEISTSKGVFKVRLEYQLAPLTVKNFVHLAQNRFYDQLYFHRVVPDFVVQGGDPTGTGWGGPGFLIPSEHSPLPFKKGSVGIATAGFDTGGCQFFICHSDQPHLNGNYTLFGKVISGMSVIDKIEVGDRILSVKFSDN